MGEPPGRGIGNLSIVLGSTFGGSDLDWAAARSVCGSTTIALGAGRKGDVSHLLYILLKVRWGGSGVPGPAWNPCRILGGGVGSGREEEIGVR